MEPWTKFRNLCAYYTDCIRYSEKSQEYLFPNQMNKTFLLPCLPYDWHLSEKEIVVGTSDNERFARHYLLKASEEQEIFVGYPINAFVSPDGFDCLCPVMMFPVKVETNGALSSGLKLTIDRDGISLNHDWVKYHVPRQDQMAFRMACEHAESETGKLDVELVLNYIGVHFENTDINPNVLAMSVRVSKAKNQLLNSAILFASTGTPYTRNLIRELRQISCASDAVLDKTALAYVFRDPPLPNEMREGEKRIPVSFTKRSMNAGQFNAVEESLNRPIVKVMGPPGTGKSFMSVNLIANEVLNGGTALFTSKNHKAIHAIYDKAPDAVEDGRFPLVKFCTTPDNPAAADWMNLQQEIDTVKGLVDSLPNVEVELRDKLEFALDHYRDAESHIRKYDSLRKALSDYERLIIDIDKTLEQVNLEDGKADRESAILERVLVQLEKEEVKGLFPRLINVILRRKEGAGVDVQGHLKLIAPYLTDAFLCKQTKCREIKRLLKRLKVKKVVSELRSKDYEALRVEQSELNYDALLMAVKDAVVSARKYVQPSYVEVVKSRISGADEPEGLIDRCKALVQDLNQLSNLSFMTTADDGTKYESAIVGVREVLRFFPAWAATMLSLRRASPCLPGVFTLAIIDEASQCDIPPMIPVLFRAQRAAIVGDPNQFPPVITLKPSLDHELLRRAGLDAPVKRKYSYIGHSVFSVVPGDAILLSEHFRCTDEIAMYFNEVFYKDGLTLCADKESRPTLPSGLKPGMMFEDVSGGDDCEMEAALQYLRNIRNKGFKGSVGVISPLRKIADRMKQCVADNKASMPAQLTLDRISTANGFQGGECDIIFFLVGLNDDRTVGRDGWYITAPENKYIYNVSVSRAKVLFVAFGDRKKVSACGIPYIEKLIPEVRKQRDPKVGYGEPILQQALKAAGIETVAQYPLLNRYLDLAIPQYKIDIEVDGMAYHFDKNGCRKADDVHRDVQIDMAGWRVVRFLHCEVVNNVAACVDRVKKMIGV